MINKFYTYKYHMHITYVPMYLCIFIYGCCFLSCWSKVQISHTWDMEQHIWLLPLLRSAVMELQCWSGIKGWIQLKVVHPRSLRCNLRIPHWKREIIFQRIIFQVLWLSLPGCKLPGFIGCQNPINQPFLLERPPPVDHHPAQPS